MKFRISASLLLILGGFLVSLHADLIIKDGSIKNDNTGPVKFDTDNDGTQDITFTRDGKVGVGITSPTHTFDLKGTFGMIPQTVSSDTTLTDNTMILADTSGGSVTLTLPLAASVTGRLYSIKKVSDSNSLIVKATDLIETKGSVTLTTSAAGFAYINVFSDGGKWNVRSQSIENSYTGTGNLLGWWPLDTPSGTTEIDFSSSGFDGTITNVASANLGVDGQIGKCIDFDGTDDYVTMGDVNDVAANEDFTVSFWFKTDDNATGQSWPGFVSKEDGAAGTRNGYVFLLNTSSSNLLSFETWSAGAKDGVDSLAVVNDNTWHHAVGVRDCSAGEVRLYLDGVLQGTDSSISTGSLSSAIEFAIGTRVPIAANTCLKTLIDDVRFYNRFLTLEEIQAVYNEGQ